MINIKNASFHNIEDISLVGKQIIIKGYINGFKVEVIIPFLFEETAKRIYDRILSIGEI
jgi:hypothetical protein